MESWPAWATERIEVHAPDPGWDLQGEHYCRALDGLLAPWVVGPVDHVGSTAVPGLWAKPVIDLQAAVVDLACADLVADALTDADWHLVPPELDLRPWRRLLVQVHEGRRKAHLHVMAVSSRRLAEQLAFRDALRADPLLARRYGALKQALAVEHAEDREGYTAAKADFIRTALARTTRGPRGGE